MCGSSGLLQPRGPVREQARGVDLRRHVCELPLNRLEVADAPSELLAFERVGARHVVCGLRDPERLGGDADPAAVERCHRHTEAAALFVEQAIPLDASALENEIRRGGRVQPELLLLTGDADMVGVEDETRDASGPGGREVGACEKQERPGAASRS